MTKAMPKDVQITTQLLSSLASKVMLKILQTKLQRYMNRGLSDVQAGFRKGRGTRDQVANIHWVIEKSREFQKNIYFCFFDYTKTLDCVDHMYPTSTGSLKKQENSRQTSTSALLTMPKPLTVWVTTNCGKF